MDTMTQAAERWLEALGLDCQADHHMRDTPRRMANMYRNEILAGLHEPMPNLTEFENDQSYDELYMVGPIEVRSLCAHHFVPILGSCWIGLLPGDRLLGLSKFHRLVHWVMARPQIQEQAVLQIADLLEQHLEPQGIAVMMKASHFCVVWRGAKSNPSYMLTQVVRGRFRKEAHLKQELLQMVEQCQ